MLVINGTDIYLTRGDSAIITLDCVNEAGATISFATGDIIYFTVKTSTDTATKTLQKIVTIAAPATEAVITLIPTDTKTIQRGEYVYDIQYTKINGEIYTIIEPSLFSIEGEVTYE